MLSGEILPPASMRSVRALGLEVRLLIGVQPLARRTRTQIAGTIGIEPARVVPLKPQPRSFGVPACYTAAMDVREQILAAFAETPRPHPKRIAVDTYDDEGTTDYFRGKPWQGHPAKTLRFYESSLIYFSPEAFRYFLPAFMLAEIDSPDEVDVAAEIIASNFSKGRLTGDRNPQFTASELQAIYSFFELCRERYGDGYKDRFKKASELVQRWAAEAG